MIAMGPSSIRVVPSGIRSRSKPAVVMFSPRAPAATWNPTCEREAKSSAGIRPDLREFGETGVGDWQKCAGVGLPLDAVAFHPHGPILDRILPVSTSSRHGRQKVQLVGVFRLLAINSLMRAAKLSIANGFARIPIPSSRRSLASTAFSA
jgi:hypothetical protein